MNRIGGVLLIVSLLVGLMSTSERAAAQTTPFADCGIMQLAPGFCLLFETANGTRYDIGPAAVTLFPGDEVFITGDLDSNCQSLCFVSLCILNASVDVCVSTVPFAECGTLVAGPGCAILETDSLATYEVENLGGFQIGDRVEVIGDLDAACSSPCALNGCILGNTIVSCGVPFRRGDVNGDGNVALNDAISALSYLFNNGLTPDCLDAADSNDDGNVALNDAILALSYLFNNGAPPADPGPDVCGLDADDTDTLADCVYGNCL